MSEAIKSFELPLRWTTPVDWAPQVLREPLALLNDHAHLEKKAARNALELLDRWPDPTPPAHWVQTMAAVARDEVEHLAQVSRILQRRGAAISLHKLLVDQLFRVQPRQPSALSIPSEAMAVLAWKPTLYMPHTAGRLAARTT